MSSPIPITKEVMSEFYQHVYPSELVCEWLQHGQRASLGRREICFTLVGDIFTRFRSYDTPEEFKADLIKNGPEKIDAGAIYNFPPKKKQTHTLIPQKRELVFDIDMTDYDAVRSCCSGKAICALCWGWMSTAALILRSMIESAFGFTKVLPVFSGRRGIHLWVCDEEARELTDDERAAIVGYLTVIKGDRVNIYAGGDRRGKNAVVNYDQPHPAFLGIHDNILAPSFAQIFLEPTRSFKHADPNTGDEEIEEIANSNCIFTSEGAAKVVRQSLVRIESQMFGNTNPKVWQASKKIEGFETLGTFALDDWTKIERNADPGALQKLKFLLLYPRLDEGVSTKRNHLLKMPFCIHPGTGKLCVPLSWDSISNFHPDRDPPKLDALLEARTIPSRWMQPLYQLQAALQNELPQV